MTFTDFLAEDDNTKKCIICEKEKEKGSAYCRDCIDSYKTELLKKYKKEK